MPNPTSQPPRSLYFPALVSLVVIVLAAVFGLWWTDPPMFPTADFSPEQARAHLTAIAKGPRRIGSQAHAEARAYLVKELESLGLSPETQEAVARVEGGKQGKLARVVNVIGRKKGTGSGKALLLMAHYDTRSMTPGASDDGYGVVALLEAARVIAAEGPLASDVIFLFTDGEEVGLFGARAFVQEHPLAKDVGLVLNFEARGGGGPVMLFQTSEESGELVRRAIAASHRPVASSLMEAVYRRMPNDTDLTVWLHRAPSLNFANIGAFERYHAPGDTVENADMATLAHHASYAISLARAFGKETLPLPSAPGATYGNIGPFCLVLPPKLGLLLTRLAAMLLVAFVVVAKVLNELRLGRYALAFVVSLGVMISAAALGFGVYELASMLDREGALALFSREVRKDMFVGAVSLASAAVVVGAAKLSDRRIGLSPVELYAGGATLLVALAIATQILLPGAAFLFTWPAFASLLLGLVVLLARRYQREELLPAALSALSAAPAIVILGPLVPMLVSAFGLLAAPASAAIFALCFTTGAFALHPIASLRLAPLVPALGSIAFLAAYLLLAPFDARTPRPTTLLYALDRGDGSSPKAAYWLSPAAKADVYTVPALTGAIAKPSSALPFPLSNVDSVLVAEAAASKEPGPELVWQDNPEADPRRLRLLVIPPKNTELLFVEAQGILSATAEDRPMPVESGKLELRYHAPPASGVPIVLTKMPSSRVTVRALSQRTGFPADVSGILQPLPAGLGHKSGSVPPWDELWESGMTLVQTTASR